MHDTIVVNCYAMVLLTKEILASFKKRWTEKKVRSLLGSTSAMASHGAAHFMQTYCASKIFIDYVSHGLNYELSEIGVDVSAWRPAGVVTNMVKDHLQKGDVSSITAEQLAKACFSKCTSGVHHGHLKHEIPGLIIDQV